MEEAREKIELFRNYYFVCFRSFDQDPYSPTHLDPINMYVVVFREGTLSVGGFYFQLPVIDLIRGVLVPLPPNTPPAKREKADQTAQGLYQRHVGLDLLCSHRRYHRRVRSPDSEHRIRSRQY